VSVDISRFNEVVPNPATVAVANQQGSTIDEHATEQQLAALLKAELPLIRCVGEEWFVYERGRWRSTNRDGFKPRALSIQNEKTRTARRAANVLSHIEGEQQCSAAEFRSFCCFGRSGEILINCANGVLEVSTTKVTLLEHKPEYLFTRQLAASFDSNATADNFERVLQEALREPKDLDLFRLFSGYLLYPDCRFEVALVCYGPGGTGKGTLISGIESVVGVDLCRHLSLEQVCNPQSKLLAQLQYAAVNIATELNAIETVGGETFKQLVSGERVQADRKYLSDISLQTGCKFLFATNYLPRFQHGTDAELRRLRFLKFDRKPDKVDVTLKSRIIGERDGIFLLMIDGLRQLLVTKQFPDGSAKSEDTRKRFKLQNDSIGAFVDQCCELTPEAEELKEPIFQAYEAFCRSNAVPPFSEAPFFRELYSRHNLRPVRRRDGDERIQRISGIKLLND
jgi:P4 family phage/plasmid primase-like protien